MSGLFQDGGGVSRFEVHVFARVSVNVMGLGLGLGLGLRLRVLRLELVDIVL